MSWPLLTSSPLAMIVDGSMLIMFLPADHVARLTTGALDPDAPVWLVRTPSPAHALAAWHRCATGRGLLQRRTCSYGRGPPPRA